MAEAQDETPINWQEAFARLRAWDAEKDRILQALSVMDPIFEDGVGAWPVCFFCKGEPPKGEDYPSMQAEEDAVQHTDDCPWARARQVSSPPPPASPEPKVPLRDFGEPGSADPPTSFGTLRLP